MLINFGTHKGKSVALVVLKHPNYINWMLKQSDITGPLTKVKPEVERLILIFDAKPIQDKCRKHNCENPVVRFAMYRGNPLRELSPLCDTCSSNLAIGLHAHYAKVETYREALRYITVYYPRSVDGYESIITIIASAKGLPAECGEAEAEAFFTT